MFTDQIQNSITMICKKKSGYWLLQLGSLIFIILLSSVIFIFQFTKSTRKFFVNIFPLIFPIVYGMQILVK